MTLITRIRKCIESQLDKKRNRFIIYPFGDVGFQFESILRDVYNIRVEYKLDDYLCRYNRNIKPLEFLHSIDCNEYIFFLASTNIDIYEELKNNLKKYVPQDRIVELENLCCVSKCNSRETHVWNTTIGKYSYGPLCRKHELVESIGSFCSFAMGVDAVLNHEMNCITTHPIIYVGKNYAEVEFEYSDYKNEPWYFEGVSPHKTTEKVKRSKIGNDVWLGRNVIITNGADIGNGVIAGAGAIITKDVPDYAVVVGAPARIVRYRYTQEQISALNKVQWWNWSDDEIRERYEDFYLPVDEFIKKYI